ncbi:MAG: hypothetical protein E7009_03665 [Alphaproteobacteria bacterium]|nr:hypothetical protein [Alphaproteobacteria bacterium]
MKKLLTITAIGAILAAPATAVQKCVNLPFNIYEADEQSYFGYNEWELRYPNIVIQGIAACSSDAGNPRDEIELDPNSDYFYCWCKMITPAVSKWVYANAEYDEFDSLEECSAMCSFQCGINISDYTEPRKQLFNNLKN